MSQTRCDTWTIPCLIGATVNLAPADMPKEGSAFDLPIAVAVLVALAVVLQKHVEGFCLVGEFGLDGRLRPIRGVLPIAAGRGV